MSPLGFKARVGSLIYTWWRHTWYMFPEIHLWCDTCWSLGGQHGSQSLASPHAYFSRGRMLDSIGRPPAYRSDMLTTRLRQPATTRNDFIRMRTTHLHRPTDHMCFNSHQMWALVGGWVFGSPEVNKFKQVSSDSHQTSLAGRVPLYGGGPVGLDQYMYSEVQCVMGIGQMNIPLNRMM